MQQVGQLSIQVSRVPRNRNYLSIDDSAVLSKPGQWPFFHSLPPHVLLYQNIFPNCIADGLQEAGQWQLPVSAAAATQHPMRLHCSRHPVHLCFCIPQEHEHEHILILKSLGVFPTLC